MVSRTQRIVRIVRDTWLIIGVSLALLFALEGAYRAQGWVRRALRSVPDQVSERHPYAGQEWWDRYQGEVWTYHFDPYRAHWPNPKPGPLITIDTSGLRVTVGPSPQALEPVKLFLLGGSAMWGYLARDQHTISSQIAVRLADRGIDWVQPINLAQTTFNATQNFNTLMLEIRRGNVPDVVVFMDGNNEVAPAFQSGQPGTILNYERINQRIYGRVPKSEAVLRRFRFVQRLQQAFGLQAPPRGPRGDSSICGDVALYYRNMVHLTEAVAEAYGFDAHFVWQPLLANSKKRLTEWEESIESPGGWRAMVQACTRAVDSLMAESPEVPYAALHSLFDGADESVFLDPFGHVTEEANGTVADAIIDLILPDLLARKPTVAPE